MELIKIIMEEMGVVKKEKVVIPQIRIKLHLEHKMIVVVDMEVESSLKVMKEQVITLGQVVVDIGEVVVLMQEVVEVNLDFVLLI